MRLIEFVLAVCLKLGFLGCGVEMWVCVSVSFSGFTFHLEPFICEKVTPIMSAISFCYCWDCS